MKIGVIGTGFVFDLYMNTLGRHPDLEIVGIADSSAERAATVGRFYGLKVYPSNEALLSDPAVEAVANFTSIESHYEVSKEALLAGKHVYSEKPLTMRLDEARDLVALAEERGLRLSCAPSNVLSASVQTLWKAVADGAVGTPRIVYAEFDDNPVPKLSPETWRSRSGAPWPYLHEYEMGCTWEHAGYHLAWMCAIFGPVRSVTAFSHVTMPDKTDLPLDPPDTPDFSVASLAFESGVVGRMTCSIAAPSDHRMRIIGSDGVVSADTYRNYDCPVRLEPFAPISLKARNMRIVRQNSVLQWIFGVGGRKVPLVPAVHPGVGTGRRRGLSPKAWLKSFLRSQYGEQDKTAGLAEMAAALREGRDQFPPHAFTLHLTELTLAIQSAGPGGATHSMETRFDPLPMPPATARAADYRRWRRPGVVARAVSGIARLTR